MLERLESGENLPGELLAPGSLKRFGCALLDWLILFAAAFPIGFVLGLSSSTAWTSPSSSAQATLSPLDLIPAVINFLYFGIGHAYYGRTVGKLAGRIRVVMQDGSPVTHKAGWIRSFIFAGLGLLAAPLYFLEDTGLGLLAIVGLAFGAFGLANAITVLVHPQKRAIHDLIAGTRVIEVG